MAKIELKQPIVEEISAGIKDAQSVVLVDYRGLTVEQDTELRLNDPPKMVHRSTKKEIKYLSRVIRILN